MSKLLGSVLLSVQNKTPSNIFIPVTKKLVESFNIFCVSTNIGETTFSLWSSLAITSASSDVITQYTLSLSVSEIPPIQVALVKAVMYSLAAH